jgi:hypothetical protein
MNLGFKDSCSSFLVEQDQFISVPLSDRLEILKKVQLKIESIAGKCYLSTQDLTTFPIVSELLPYFINETKGDNGEAPLEYINGPPSMESYKWFYNLIYLNLYFFCLCSLHNLILPEVIDPDLITEFRVQERILYAKLDPSIRHHIRKQGLGVTSNTYVGFDTEFNNLDIKRNSLISAQLAITSKIYLKIPKSPRYTISKLDLESNKLHRLKTSSVILNYSKVETSMQ